MPERILRDYTTSDKFDGFAGSPETLFTRLLTKVDDYGRFSADPVNVRGACYPRAENLRANTVAAWLEELSGHRLILCYQVLGKPYLSIVNFRQRLKQSTAGNPPVPKYPPMDGRDLHWRPDDGDWREVSGCSGNLPPYASANAEAGTQAKPSTKSNHYSTLKGKGGAGEGEGAKGNSEMGNIEHRTSNAECPTPKVQNCRQESWRTAASSTLKFGDLARVAGEIMGNDWQWCWDNCKVKVTDFTLASLMTVLRQFVERASEKQVRKCWIEAVGEAHRQAVDFGHQVPGDPEDGGRDPVRSPAGLATEKFRALLNAEIGTPEAGKTFTTNSHE